MGGDSRNLQILLPKSKGSVSNRFIRPLYYRDKAQVNVDCGIARGSQNSLQISETSLRPHALNKTRQT